MEKRNVKISFSRSGNGIGAKLTLPMPYMKALRINKEENEIELILDEEKQIIIIKKR